MADETYGIVRERMTSLNFNDDEIAAFIAADQLTKALRKLERYQDDDWHETVHAIHSIQDKILARPAVRTILAEQLSRLLHARRLGL